MQRFLNENGMRIVLFNGTDRIPNERKEMYESEEKRQSDRAKGCT